MAKKVIRPLRSEADYDAALEEIERYFESVSRSPAHPRLIASTFSP
jgi:antitoxin component HigA of HigAB toxin-antitoxin module